MNTGNCAQISAHSTFYGCVSGEVNSFSFGDIALVKFLNQSQPLRDTCDWDGSHLRNVGISPLLAICEPYK